MGFGHLADTRCTRHVHVALRCRGMSTRAGCDGMPAKGQGVKHNDAKYEKRLRTCGALPSVHTGGAGGVADVHCVAWMCCTGSMTPQVALKTPDCHC